MVSKKRRASRRHTQKRRASRGGTKKIKNKNLECSVCLEPINRHSYKTKCGHYFHKRCKNAFFNSKSETPQGTQIPCPMCRRDIQSEYKGDSRRATQNDDVVNNININDTEGARAFINRAISNGKEKDPREPMDETTHDRLSPREKDYIIYSLKNKYPGEESVFTSFNEHNYKRKLGNINWDPNYILQDNYYYYIDDDDDIPIINTPLLSKLFLQIFDKVFDYEDNLDFIPDEIANEIRGE